MIGEMKREALHSLKGKWGLGVGSTILYHIVSYVVSMAVMLILLIPGVIIVLLASISAGSIEEDVMAIELLLRLGFLLSYDNFKLCRLWHYHIWSYEFVSTNKQTRRC